jgi:hypothetical protein
MKPVRRDRRTLSTALLCAAFLSAAVVCPCPPQTGTNAVDGHGCCAPAAAIRAAETACCAEGGGPARTAVTASPAPLFSAPLPFETFADAPAQSTVPLASPPPETAASAPFVLRV